METKRPLTVLIATGLYAPEIGGPATYTRSLEQQLPAAGIALIVEPFTTVRHLPKWKRHFSYFMSVLKKSKDVDVLYALDGVSVGLPVLLASFVRRKPFLLRLGGDYAWEQGQQRFGLTQNLDEYTSKPVRVPLRVKLLAFVQACVAKKAYKVIAPSQYLKRIITSWGVEEKKVEVIYSALNPLSIEDSKSELRRVLGYEGKVITSAGRLVPWKGFSELIDTFAQLQKDIPDLFLVIIGEGPQEEVLKAKVEKLVLNRKVSFTGALSKKELGERVKASDVFVLNTSYEGLSHQLLEVMDLGVAVLATDIGGNPELIENEVSGLLVPVDDHNALYEALRRLVENEALRTRLLQTARVRVREFTHEKGLQKLVSLLQESVLKKQRL